MKLHKKKMLVSILSTLLGLSLVTNIYLYLENDYYKESSYEEFDDSKRSLIHSIESYIESLEEVKDSEAINYQHLHSLTSATLSSISEQSQVSLLLYYYIANEENVDRYQDDFGDFWGPGLTEIADVETKEELDEHISDLKRHLENFKEDLKEY